MNRGLLIALITVIVWSWPTIFITLLSKDFDVITQNFFRYSAGSLLLLIWVVIFWRREFVAAGRNLRHFILPTLLVFFFQIVWVEAIYLTTPTISTLLSKLDIVFIALFSFILFRAERRIIRSRYFVLGCSLALLGVVGVVLGRGEAVGSQFDTGVALLLLRSLLWTAYILSLRNLVTEVGPIIAAAWVFLFASLLFLPAALLYGDVHRVAEVPLSTSLLLFGSGALCVGIGNALNYTAIKYLGTTLPTSLLLLTPFSTGVLSYFLCGETLTATQIASGVLIILGCLLIIRKVVAAVTSAG